MNPRTAKKIKMTMNTKTPIKMLVAIFFLFSIACCEFFAGPGRIPDMIFFFGEKKRDCLFLFFASRFFFLSSITKKIEKNLLLLSPENVAKYTAGEEARAQTCASREGSGGPLA